METNQPSEGASANEEDKIAEPAPIRQFRSLEFKSKPELLVDSGRTGRPVTIPFRNLTNHQKSILSNICDFIEGKLKGTEYEEEIMMLAQMTGFCITNSKHVNGYSVELNDEFIVVLNGDLFKGPTDELAITVLHELLHYLFEPYNGGPASLSEAEHDLAYYALLGIDLSPKHWALIKYPHLLDEMTGHASKAFQE